MADTFPATPPPSLKFSKPAIISYITCTNGLLPMPDLLFNRDALLQKLAQPQVWDVLVIGGGATGLGIAVDAATRGYKTALLEKSDFAKGTSSRSTKLVHGGVRYLAQGNLPLVYSALQERGRLLKNAPHLVHRQAFLIPCYSWMEKMKYLVGLKIYDWLAGRWSFGASKVLSKRDVTERMPGIKEQQLKGGVLYFDGQFDDARLAVNLAQTAIENGAVVLNYIEVTGLLKDKEKVSGALARDVETGNQYQMQAKVVINATGVFADSIHQMDTPDRKAVLRQSQGTHIVIDQSHLQGNSALMIPKTRDGRVLFAIPWYNQVLVGTTDTPVARSLEEPVALKEEIAFILETLNKFVKTPVTTEDIRAVFAGLRPLVLPQKEVVSTKELSRDHKILVAQSNLISIIGGKWTTYRKMAEESLDTAIKRGLLHKKTVVTKSLPVHGFTEAASSNALSQYGSDASAVGALMHSVPGGGALLHPHFPFTEAEVIWAVTHELARNVEDVLARRLRLLFLDAEAAIAAAPRVARLMREMMQQTESWETKQLQQFVQLARQYGVAPIHKQPHPAEAFLK
jgi:glycerol-3-phosphate dehydrogenase